MNFDHFRGSIATDSEIHEACLVVDGKKMSMADLERGIVHARGPANRGADNGGGTVIIRWEIRLRRK